MFLSLEKVKPFPKTVGCVRKCLMKITKIQKDQNPALVYLLKINARFAYSDE